MGCDADGIGEVVSDVKSRWLATFGNRMELFLYGS